MLEHMLNLAKKVFLLQKYGNLSTR